MTISGSDRRGWRARPDRSAAWLAWVVALYLAGCGESPLLRAVRANDLAEAVRQLEGGADPEAVGARGDTALHLASSGEMAKLLLKHRCPLEARNVGGNTPLHRAAYLGRAAVVEVLLGAGAACDPVNTEGNTPLVLAAMDVEHHPAEKGLGELQPPDWPGKRAAVSLLLRHGANVNFAGDRGTALYVGVRSGGLELVQVLLQAGADPTLPGAGGLTPLEYVRGRHWGEDDAIVRALEVAMAGREGPGASRK